MLLPKNLKNLWGMINKPVKEVTVASDFVDLEEFAGNEVIEIPNFDQIQKKENNCYIF